MNTYIVATYDNNSSKLFINNELVQQIEVQKAISDNSTPFRIGLQSQNFSNSSYYRGAIDDIVVYNRALSKNEIRLLYEAN
ncbi:MAG: LamG domain-containing protein [Bacteroidales bacterium]|nr:LamG domain-containing protein [Bacteroidales bacterium]